jgi:hypothetical protein
MHAIVTSDVHAHRVNQNYECLLYEFVDDPTFHITVDWQRRIILNANWMPKETDVLTIVNDLLRISPSFPARLLDVAANIRVRQVGPKREIKNLAELLIE